MATTLLPIRRPKVFLVAGFAHRGGCCGATKVPSVLLSRKALLTRYHTPSTMPAGRDKDDKQPTTPSNPRGTNSPHQVPLYALISLCVFGCCIAVLFVLITNAEKLNRFGLLQQIYYLNLVLVGLAASGFLFGVLQSTATYAGRFWGGGNLRLSGSVVGATLVVIGGYYFLPKATTLPLTVYVHGEGGPQDIVLRNSGRVVLKLGPAPQSESIGENGQALFPAVPSDFRGRQVEAWVESDTYVSPGINVTLDGTSLDLQVKKKVQHFKLAGTVLDSSGKSLAGVRIAVPEYKAETQTNKDGWYELRIDTDEQRLVDLVAQKQDYETARFSSTLGDSGFNFVLKRSP